MDAAGEKLARIARGFEKQFAYVTQIDTPPIQYLVLQPHGPETEKRVQLDHRSPAGDGLSADEAIADWQAKLPVGEFAVLVWRVKPEIIAEKDFSTQITRWRVWSRFAMAERREV